MVWVKNPVLTHKSGLMGAQGSCADCHGCCAKIVCISADFSRSDVAQWSKRAYEHCWGRKLIHMTVAQTDRHHVKEFGTQYYFKTRFGMAGAMW